MNRLSTVMEVASSIPVTVPCFPPFLFIYVFIYLFVDTIYEYNQTIWVAEYSFNDRKQCIPY